MATRRKGVVKKGETCSELVDRVRSRFLGETKKVSKKKEEIISKENEINILVSKSLINKCLRLKRQKEELEKKELLQEELIIEKEELTEDLLESENDLSDKEVINEEKINNEEENNEEESEDEESDGEEMISVLNRKGEELWIKDDSEVYMLDINGEGEFIGLMEESKKSYDFIYKGKKYLIMK